MGQAKQRGTKEQRTAQAVEIKQQLQSEDQQRLQKSLQYYRERQVQLETTMGPIDRQYAQQQQMIQKVAQRLKERNI